ncbi:MAG TPA: tRNA (guanosine(37)-N1)-methyltransferase TrmD [Chloroflexota bacterium]|nr:tRNA (guanosine(37)-N1)-methyltransferase TrmD [Chloroflexota bacterium]
MLRIDILTIFPEMFRGPFDASILKRAREAGLIAIHVHDIRSFTHDRHHTTDDYPFGGGAGMVMKVQPVVEAVEYVCQAAMQDGIKSPAEVILFTPAGQILEQSIAKALAAREHLVLICGRYEGVDERVEKMVVSREISIGDYVLTGGELPAMVLVDTVARLVPGVLGASESLAEESISSGLLEYPQYTRPFDFRGEKVPAVLLSGDHQAVAAWRRCQALRRTFERRPDLLVRAPLSQDDGVTLSSFVRLPEPP